MTSKDLLLLVEIVRVVSTSQVPRFELNTKALNHERGFLLDSLYLLCNRLLNRSIPRHFKPIS